MLYYLTILPKQINSTCYLFYFSLSLLLSFSLKAQDFNHYETLRSSGQIPAELLQLTSQKYEEERQKIAVETNPLDRKDQERFLLKTNFMIDELLLSGSVLYNDVLGNYVNKVADQVLKEAPLLRKKLRFYIVKSPHTNAFATANGIVLINMGLLAQLENEAQLAYILSHEISHYVEEHGMERYEQNLKIDKNASSVSRTQSVEQRFLAKAKYSKEIELEADLSGLFYFAKTDYSYKEIITTFDVLLYAHLPFDNIPFDESFLEKEHFVFPKAFILDSIAKVEIDENYDDEYSSHPNVFKRKEKITAELKKNADQFKGTQKFIVSEAEFLKVQKIARYEIAQLYLSNLQYETAIYHLFLLMQSDPDSRYLNITLLKSLYAIAKYANRDLYDYTEVREDLAESEVDKVNYIFEGMNGEEILLLSLLHAWDMKAKFPQDEEVAIIYDDLIKEFVAFYEPSLADYATAPKPSKPKNKPTQTADETTTEPEKEKSEAEVNLDDLAKYALVDLLKDDSFVEQFKKEETAYRNAKPSNKKRKLASKNEEKNIKKAVIVNPGFYVINNRKKDPIRFLKTENKRLDLIQGINQNADLLNLDVSVLSNMNLKTNDMDVLNDLSFLNTWFSERLNHKNIEIHTYDKAKVTALKEKYGTTNFVWIGAASLRNRGKISQDLLLLSTIIGFIPFIYNKITHAHDTYFFALVFNIETQEVKLRSVERINTNANKNVMNAFVYDILNQISHIKLD